MRNYRRNNDLRTSALRCGALAAVIGAAGMVAGCVQQGPPPAAPPPAQVTVAKPVVRDVTNYFEFPGRTEAIGEVEVRARVTGYLCKVNFVDGQIVTQGDLLYEIDPRPYQAALNRAKGELARSLAMADKAEADMARGERLRPSGAISQDEYEQHVANLAVQRASIQTAEAAIEDAELNLEFTKIRAPIDGRVSRTRVTEGNLVQPGTNDNGILTTVVTIKPIYVYFNVEEHVLLQYQEMAVKKGISLDSGNVETLKIPVEMGLASETGYPHLGVLDFMDNKIDASTGTLRARGVFKNEDGFLTPGLYVRVRMPFGDPHPALLVTDRAIGTDQRQKYLLTVVKDDQTHEDVVHYAPVKVGRALDGLRVIESGLTVDDLVIVNGLQRARPGAAVTATLAPAAESSVAAAPAPALARERATARADRPVTN